MTGEVTVPSVMEVCSNTLRGIIVAMTGHKLIAADLSNIEGRVLAWLAGEEWKLEAFRAFDRGQGPDMYRLAYGRPFRVEPSAVNTYQRQIGKGMELSLGYEGGVGAFLNIAAAYGLDIPALALAAYDTLPKWARDEALEFHDWAQEQGRTYGLTLQQFVTCDALKRMWRKAHPATTLFWADCAMAARVVITQGTSVPVGHLTFDKRGNWMRIRLPSGRYICYPAPEVSESGISYKGMVGRRWQRIHTYSGKFAENVTQAVARDVMAAAMPKAEKHGYKLVMHCHDELVAEVPDEPHYTATELSAILATNPSWADGLPLAAAGHEMYRYGK